MFALYAIQWIWKSIEETRSDVLYSLLVFLIVFGIVRLFQWLKHLTLLPPGPWGYPIIGYLPFIKGDLHLAFGKLAEKYGSMFSARLGSQFIVVLSDYRMIRDAFRREEFSGRPHTEFMNILGGYGIINTEGAMWKDQRKFLHEKLRSFGMTYQGNGKKVMGAKIMREVKALIHGLSLKHGAPTDVSPWLAMAISNVVCSVIMGVRFHDGDSRFKRFMALIDEGFKLFGSIVLINFIPIMRYLPGSREIRTKISHNRTEMAAFFQETVDKHRNTFDKTNIRDLIDFYLLEIETAKAEDRGSMLFQGRNHDRQINQILGDLFSAGMETVKTTLEWAVVLMLHHPEAAKAVQEELDEVVGRSRMPALEDLPYLPITEATILEVLRRSSIVPLGTTHATTRNIKLNGYTIPAGAQVVPLLHAVHMDPNLWAKPEDFRPARFLTTEGKVTKPEYFMPFGVGRRMCLGDILARMELTLFFSSLLHTFNIELPEGDLLPSLEGNAGVTVTPDPFQVCLIQRHPDMDGILDYPLRNFGSH